MRSTFKFLLLLILSASFLFTGCNTYKEVPLFEDAPAELSKQISNFKQVSIQPHDMLGISVSSLNPDASAIFSPPQPQVIGNGNQTQDQIQGFLVDTAGNITIPYIGTLHVGGLSTSAASELIRQKLGPYLKEPVVNTRILNFKIGVFGGVSQPGIFRISNERATIVEAIILAGDLELTAKRSNILLIRESGGERKLVRLDLRTIRSLESPYYYLQTNDVIYVEPGTSLEKRSALYSSISIVASVVSFALILFRL